MNEKHEKYSSKFCNSATCFACLYSAAVVVVVSGFLINIYDSKRQQAWISVNI